ncbi:MAG TPA: glycosyltransferase [Rubricoccaceae bacterium]
MADALLPALVVAFAVNVLAWGWVAVGWRRMADALDADGLDPDGPAAAPPGLPLSVAVAAHDEAGRLPALLRALRRQTHRGTDGRPAFEVVVVDDRSTDGTAALVERTAAAWAATGGPVLRLVRVDPDETSALPPKKRALTAGVAAATHERLVLTDADTDPPATWIATLARFAAPAGHDDGAVLVGYGPYTKRPGGLNLFVRYETLQTAALAAAGVGWGRPWHAVGRNLSYPKALFDRVGGFEAGAGSLSGDDDLFVQHVARERAAAVRYVPDAGAAVPSGAPETWGAFWRQKRRHASAGAHYTPAVLVALGALHLSALVLWIGAPLLHGSTGAPTGYGFVALHLLVQRAALGPAFDALGAGGDLRFAQPLLDLASTLYHGALMILGALPAPRRW